MKIINPTKESRCVAWRDLPRVFWEATKMKAFMMSPLDNGYHASALSHCQVEGGDPLRFFVLGNSWHVFEGVPMKLKRYFGFPWARVIMNPVVVSHGTEHDSMREVCFSVDTGRPRKVKRWRIVECEYLTFFGRRRRKFYMYRAAVILHEINHMDCVSIEDVWKHRK